MRRARLFGESQIAQLASIARASSSRARGGNSVVSAVKWMGATVAVKEYGPRPDTWTRMEREWRALELLAGLGTELAPDPLGISRNQEVVIQSWIEGEAPPAQANPTVLLSLLTNLKQVAGTPESASIQSAADAIERPADLLEQTILRCESLVESPVVREPAQALLSGCLSAVSPEYNEPWASTLSPSDFGPHNMLISQGGPRIIDLEFFGWDDPHKLVADTLLHPLVVWTSDTRDVFVREASDLYGLDGHRLRQVYSFAQAKWSAIVLGRAVREANALRQQATIDSIKLADRYFTGFASSIARLD